MTAGKKAQVTDRIHDHRSHLESLVFYKGMKDALYRADRYLDAGADAIMIHSKNKSGDEIIEFCQKFRSQGFTAPLVVVPSTYSHITEKQLQEAGASGPSMPITFVPPIPVMLKTAETILKNGRSFECDDSLMPVSELLNLIPGGS